MGFIEAWYSKSVVLLVTYIYNLCLCAIEHKLILIGGLQVEAYGLPTADWNRTMQRMSRQYWREINYNKYERYTERFT